MGQAPPSPKIKIHEIAIEKSFATKEIYKPRSKNNPPKSKQQTNLRLPKIQTKQVQKCEPFEKASWIWPGGLVPYKISFDQFKYSNLAKKINEAMLKFIQQTSIRFKQIPIDECPLYYVSFEISLDDKDYAYANCVGRKLNGQKIVLNPNKQMKIGNIMHEIMHVLGFEHEHKRIDRNQNVEIDQSLANNQNYKIKEGGVCLGSYDFESIMHYPCGKKMKSKTTFGQQNAGQRANFSEGDLLGIKYVYGSPICTYNNFGEQYFVQKYYECITCWGNQTIFGICEFCREKCHANHQVLLHTSQELADKNMEVICHCGRMNHQLQKCTKYSTKYNQVQQNLYQCYTCSNQRRPLYICKICYEQAHSSHYVQFLGSCNFYCEN